MLLLVGRIQNWYLTVLISDFKRNTEIQLFGVVHTITEQSVNVDYVQLEILSKSGILIIMNLQKLTLPILVKRMW